MTNEHGYSIVPPSAVFQDDWPTKGVFTQGFNGALSVAGWTSGNEGFQQQTFLGASIRSFNVSAGFGDSSSTMGIELVNDEFNKSDNFNFGIGDDVYHNGVHDKFRPPVVGAPVFFKFGKNFATVEQAFRKDFDQIYSTPSNVINTLDMPADPFPISVERLPVEEHPQGFYLMDKNVSAGTARWIDKSALEQLNTKWRGFSHFTFGGILQSYTENRSSAGNPLYSVKLVDPREILSNTELVLNNYAGTTFNNKNLYNIYGFLEYDPSDKLKESLESTALDKQVLTKNVSPQGVVTYTGTDRYRFVNPFDSDNPIEFPVTGQGFSRRGQNGIPWYRVSQALQALFSYNYELPQEYIDAGFGGVIDFRGYNYVVDFGGIPTELIPLTYYLDFDKLNMLDLAQELCDVLSRELFVSLLPVIDHPSCANLFAHNEKVMNSVEDLDEDDPKKAKTLGDKLIAGIIRVDSIDKSVAPKYGAVKNYLDNLELNDVFVESRDVGFEVSNVVTDKFIAGAQEVEMYYFNTLRDRDTYLKRLENTGDGQAKQRLQQISHDKWTLDTNLKQQVIPFYGFIGDKAVTIPRGFGSYQQILLDATSLDAHGVGPYYVATEMELRAASVSYEKWQNFLLTYNEIYIQELGNNQAFFAELSTDLTKVVAGINDQLEEGSPVKQQLDQLTKAGRSFGVSVPRSVWNSSGGIDSFPFEGKMDGGKDAEGNPNGFPTSPCNPPYGYPLYYKRAEKIGIPQAGMSKITGGITTIITSMETLENMQRSDKQRFRYVKSLAEQSKGRLRALILEKKTRYYDTGLTDTAKHELLTDIAILAARMKEIDDNVTTEGQELKNLRGNRSVQIGELKKAIKGSTGLIKNIGRLQRDSLKNARKVYNFVKKVADDNLGKKFLVKIPKSCNVNYSSSITNKDFAWDVIRGPFGFKPRPVSSIPGYEGGLDWSAKVAEFKAVAKTAERQGPSTNQPGEIWAAKSNAHWHYLDTDAMGQAAAEQGATNLVHYGDGYTFGALKCNYNPMTEKWEHNYKPEPQGGFFNFALYDKNLKVGEVAGGAWSDAKMPKATRNLLAPQLVDKLVANSNRIQCYVRYDHSQHLDFSSINSDSVEQQAIGADGQTFVPDVMELLPNLHPDKKESLNLIQARIQDDKDLDRQGESVAFVKCELDSQFYMAPQQVGGDATVWAEDFSVTLTPAPYEVAYVDGTGDNKGCKIPKVVKQRPIVSFGVKNGGLFGDGAHKVRWDDFDRYYSDTYNAWIVNTEEKNLDSDHVYALITVPGRITPTVDKRYVDGPQRAFGGVSIANAMTEDVVKIHEFTKPGLRGGSEKEINCDTETLDVEFTFEDLSRAKQAQKDMAKGVTLSNGNASIMAFTSPSPIYPDLVALPLMSMERCYGPWISSALDQNALGVKFSDIGGKIEFEKDESLAPWSYAGYQLMNEAAKMKTEFSNSLLLFSERGSFSYADAPIDVSLARALQSLGPLVTSISVDIGAAVKTSVKLDLYTSQFGKLQKQKEIAIAQISRERQKIIDQNNVLRRRGIGKGAANMDIMGSLPKTAQTVLDMARKTEEFTEIEKGIAKPASMITMSSTNTRETRDASDGTSVAITSVSTEGAMQSEADVTEMASFIEDPKQLASTMDRTAGAYISDVFAGTSENPQDTNFASYRKPTKNQKDQRIL